MKKRKAVSRKRKTKRKETKTMAAVSVTINNANITGEGGEIKDGTITGELSLTGLGVGGGPIIPEPPVKPPGKPTFPIWGPPGMELPPGTGYPPVAGHPLPPEGSGQPPGGGGGGGEPGPIDGWEAKIIWSEETGWAVIIVPAEGTPVPTPSRRR
jgi:hypothetical protein